MDAALTPNRSYCILRDNCDKHNLMHGMTIEDAYSHDRTPPMLTENPGRRQEGSQDVASSCPGLKQQYAASDGKEHA